MQYIKKNIHQTITDKYKRKNMFFEKCYYTIIND